MTAEIVFMIRNASLQGAAFRALRRELRSLALPGQRLTLDLTGIEQMDSKVARLILDLSSRLNARGGSLRLSGVGAGVHAFLELVGLHRTVAMKTNWNMRPLGVAA